MKTGRCKSDRKMYLAVKKKSYDKKEKNVYSMEEESEMEEEGVHS